LRLEPLRKADACDRLSEEFGNRLDQWSTKILVFKYVAQLSVLSNEQPHVSFQLDCTLDVYCIRAIVTLVVTEYQLETIDEELWSRAKAPI
jgi:hypothetical protein